MEDSGVTAVTSKVQPQLVVMAVSQFLAHVVCSLNAYDLSCWEELEDLGTPCIQEEVGDLEWSHLNLAPEGGVVIKL